MAQPAKWPPFIHPLVSSPHFDERDVEPPPTTPQPLKPLAACRVISQGFVARSEGSMDFLWRSIEAEERWIKSDVSISPKRNGRSVQLTDAQMHKFSLGELLAAMQAMVIYTIMRMIDFGPDYFTEHDGMIVTMQDLAYVYSSCVPGPFSPPHERKAGFRWKDWLCEEVRRRTAWLESGDIKPLQAKVVEGGLEGLQSAMDEVQKGVSGVKLVVEV
ncbi:Putative exopolygalacturonase B [Verticillium dahliae VDG1]|nr:Putative exopolygalacturonase B [Verticillium dahliae VDG1]